MKKALTVIMMAAAIVGCSSERHVPQPELNAIQYAHENLFGGMTGVKSVCVTVTDSVLTDDMIDERQADMLADRLAGGSLSCDEFSLKFDSIGTVLYEIWETWQGGYHKAHVEGKYPGQWRTIYTVTATMESGAIHNIRVLMKKDGTTPDMTEREYKDRQKKKQGIMKDVARELWR